MVTDGRLLALNSYENRVYQIHIEDSDPIIAKYYRPKRWSQAALLEEHAFSLNAAQMELAVVPPLCVDGESLFRHAGFSYALFKRQGGQWPELNSADERVLMGRCLGRLHALGDLATFEHRPSLEPLLMVEQAAQFILRVNVLPEHQVSRYQDTIAHIIEIVETCLARCGAIRQLRIHGDCHRGNVLWTEQGPHFVDLDDSQNGPAVQDLWMLLAGDQNERRAQWADLIEGYEQFRVFPRHEWVLIPALRLARMVHYAAWLQKRFADPAFPRAFPWFATPRYWDEHIQSLQDEIHQFAIDSSS